MSFSFPARVFLLFSRCCSLSDSLACSLAYLTGSGESFVVRHRRKGYSCPACRERIVRTVRFASSSLTSALSTALLLPPPTTLSSTRISPPQQMERRLTSSTSLTRKAQPRKVSLQELKPEEERESPPRRARVWFLQGEFNLLSLVYSSPRS